jgi:predicted RNA-binding Zn-ribbon protein involved in translation (DUF1610 family)
MTKEPTPREVLEGRPKTCCACGKVMTRQEVKAHPDLCGDCAATIDRDTKAREEDWSWFE